MQTILERLKAALAAVSMGQGDTRLRPFARQKSRDHPEMAHIRLGRVEELDSFAPDDLEQEQGFARASPLTRKIVWVNLLGLSLLVIGLLFTDKFESGLIEQRETALVREAEMIAGAMDRFAVFGSEMNPVMANALLQTLSGPTDAHVRMYDDRAYLIGDSEETQGALEPPSLDDSPVSEEDLPAQQLGLLAELMLRLREFWAYKPDPNGRSGEDLTDQQLDKISRAAIAGEPQRVVSTNSLGEVIVSVALPVRSSNEVVGAVIVSTFGGDIDALVRADRSRQLQVFLFALLSSIVLSLVLANTIARPIRMLAHAAEMGGVSSKQRLNPGRIRIPDLSGRPDEIGYLSKAMRNMTEALYDRIEANEEFAADVAHEIKNPLTSLRSAVETFRYVKDDNGRRRLLDVIEQDVDRLDRLVTDISNASRLDSELVRGESAHFDLLKLLRNLVEYNQPNAEDVGGALVARLPDGAMEYDGLEGRLAQVFVNLITNALSFTPEGGAVTVTAQRGGSMGGVRITVEDQGPGIPDENLQDVFSRFYSERPNQEFGNHSGLGLAISKQIVEAHGGKIWAENIRAADAGIESPRLGARFVVDLP